MTEAANPYVCPRCGTQAEGSSYCGSCGLHLDAVELPRKSEFAGPTEVTESELPQTGLAEQTQTSGWRILALVAVVLLGGFGLAQPDEPCSAFYNVSDAAGNIVSAALASLFWVAVVATVVFVIRRMRRRPARWSLLDTTTLVTALVMVVLASVGASAQRADDCGPGDSAAASVQRR